MDAIRISGEAVSITGVGRSEVDRNHNERVQRSALRLPMKVETRRRPACDSAIGSVAADVEERLIWKFIV